MDKEKIEQIKEADELEEKLKAKWIAKKKQAWLREHGENSVFSSSTAGDLRVLEELRQNLEKLRRRCNMSDDEWGIYDRHLCWYEGVIMGSHTLIKQRDRNFYETCYYETQCRDLRRERDRLKATVYN